MDDSKSQTRGDLPGSVCKERREVQTQLHSRVECLPVKEGGKEDREAAREIRMESRRLWNPGVQWIMFPGDGNLHQMLYLGNARCELKINSWI